MFYESYYQLDKGENLYTHFSKQYKKFKELEISSEKLDDQRKKEIFELIGAIDLKYRFIIDISKKIIDLKDQGDIFVFIDSISHSIKNEEKFYNLYASGIDDIFEKLSILEQNLDIIFTKLKEFLLNKSLAEYNAEATNKLKDLNLKYFQVEEKLKEVNNLNEDLKNKEVHQIFEDDSEKFKTLARRYEIAFYLALAFLFLYFFGWYVEIDTANFKFKFAEQFHGNHTPTFYVQKISLLILSTTLAAFLLKRSFMNRRLADDAYRTAKELDALPRYMEGMPDEMKEKIRFDLAYKYFGNGIHHESYTGGENLMHENIKANTDFIKAVKDLTPKVEVPKADKASERCGLID